LANIGHMGLDIAEIGLSALINGIVGFGIFTVVFIAVRRRIIEMLQDAVTDRIEEFATQLAEKPEIVAGMLKKPVELLMADIGKQIQPQIGIGAGIGALLPRKYQGLLALAQMFGIGVPAPQQGQTEQQLNKSPFE
jgi:hypothetical protein